jgi:hypothetical protein
MKVREPYEATQSWGDPLVLSDLPGFLPDSFVYGDL